MKKILIPTDFSLNSYQTIDYVTSLFINEHCEFYFLNTYTHGITGLNAIELLQTDSDFFDIPKEESLNQLGKLLEHYTLNSQERKHTFYAISESMGLMDGIMENIEKIGVDLVIITGNTKGTVGKNTESILEKIRSCPILIVPSHASICEGLRLTIASDFKQRLNTLEIDKFIKSMENTNFEIGILVLEEQNTLTSSAADNLESLIIFLKQFSNKQIDLEYIQSKSLLKEYAESHLDGIMCIVDKKPDFLRKIGLYKSDIISTLGKLSTNTVLTIHQ